MQDCIHHQVTDTNGLSASKPTRSSPATPNAPNLSSATRLQPWQPPQSTQPRSYAHLISRPLHSSNLVTNFLQPQPGFVEGPYEHDSLFASYPSYSVTTEPDSVGLNHFTQVTNSQAATSTIHQSPTLRHSATFGNNSLVEHNEDYKYSPYLHSSLVAPFNMPMNKSSMQSGGGVGHEGNQNDARTLDADLQYNGIPQFNAQHVNPMASGSFHHSAYSIIPTEQDLNIAAIKANAIYKTYHNEQGLVKDDQTRIDSYRRLDPQNLPKSINLHNIPAPRTYFPDGLTAEAYRASCRPNRMKPDETIPRTTAAQQAHVRLLVLAFNSTDAATDNEQMQNPFKMQRHDQKLVECLCWQILRAIISRAEFADPIMTSYDVQKARDSIGLNNFAQRFDAVIEGMMASKTICKHMFDAPYFCLFVDDPMRSKARVESNRALNKVKAQQMAEGKKVQEEKAAAEGLPLPPPKRKRTTRVATTPLIDPPQSPFRASAPGPRTPQRVNQRQSARQAGKNAVSYGMPNDSSMSISPYFSSPGDMVLSPTPNIVQQDNAKSEYPRPYNPPTSMFQPFGGQNPASPAYSTTVSSPRTPHFVDAMGPAPPGPSAPMQRDSNWNSVRLTSNQDFSHTDSMQHYNMGGAYDSSYSPHGLRQPTTFEQEVTHYGSGEPSTFDQTVRDFTHGQDGSSK